MKFWVPQAVAADYCAHVHAKSQEFQAQARAVSKVSSDYAKSCMRTANLNIERQPPTRWHRQGHRCSQRLETIARAAIDIKWSRHELPA